MWCRLAVVVLVDAWWGGLGWVPYPLEVSGLVSVWVWACANCSTTVPCEPLVLLGFGWVSGLHIR
jgi:hypothetical protein